MKKQAFQELKGKPIEELSRMLQEQRMLLRNLKFDLVAGKLKNVDEIKRVKRLIARILTLIQEHKTQSSQTIQS